MTDRAPAAPAISALTGIRGYAALWVLVSHLVYTEALLWPLAARLQLVRPVGLIQHEYLAVDVFFMLSGFVLLHVYRREFESSVRRPEYGRFLLLRLARIYPLHLVGLGLALVTLQYHPDPFGISTEQTFVLQLVLMASWGVIPRISWNLPAWSLNSEWFAYLLFPLVALVGTGIKTTRGRLIGIGALLGFFYIMMFRQPFPPLGYDSGIGAQTRVMVGLSIGILLRGLYDDPRVRALPWHLILYGSLVAAAISMTELSGARRLNSIWSYMTMPLILFAAACGKGRLMLPLTGRFAIYMGEISFAIYIMHYPVLRLIRTVFWDRLVDITFRGTDLQVWVVMVGAGLLAVVAGALAHHAIEDPFRRWAKRRIMGKVERRTEAALPAPSA
jgi:peptidoglycan/LPS O-acetylase OafA/YrhL